MLALLVGALQLLYQKSHVQATRNLLATTTESVPAPSAAPLPTSSAHASPSLTAIEKAPFEVTETGWGEFDIIIKIFFVPEAFEKPLTFTHHLKLHPWPLDLSSLPPAPPPLPLNPDGTEPEPLPSSDPPALVLSPVHSWQYEEIVFVEPTELFYSTLLATPPSPLPTKNRHPKTLVHALGGGGNFGEFSGEMESSEGGRMDEARKKALREIEEMRKVLVGHEKELQGGFFFAIFASLSSRADQLPPNRPQEGSRGDSSESSCS